MFISSFLNVLHGVIVHIVQFTTLKHLVPFNQFVLCRIPQIEGTLIVGEDCVGHLQQVVGVSLNFAIYVDILASRRRQK